MSLVLLCLGQALAAPLMLRISDPEQRMVDPVSGVAEANGVEARFVPVDDGSPPDVLAGDGVRSVVVQAPEAEALTLTLTDSRGEVWSQRVELAPGAQLDLDLRVGEDGSLEAYAPMGGGGSPASSGGGPTSQPRGTPQLDGAASRTLPWAAAVAGWVFALVLLWRGEGRRAPPAPAPVTPATRAPGATGAGVRRVRCDPDEQALILSRLAQGRRVLWVGELPSLDGSSSPQPGAPVPEGAVFLVDPEVEAVVVAARQLRSRGRPLVVVLAAPARALEGEVGPERVAEALGGVPVVVLTPEGEHRVEADGRLLS